MTTTTTSSAPAVNLPRPGARPAQWVSFVGAGPGDPDLLTVRAVELIKAADIVITELPEHIELVRSVLGIAPPPVDVDEDADEAADASAASDDEAEAIPEPLYVDGGFNRQGRPLTHGSRAKLVLRHAKTGKRVVRLMNGDPFFYASGPEEAQACAKEGVGFEIVPGISSVNAVPAYAGIPLTTRRHREVTVLSCTGAAIKWADYVNRGTLVLLSAVEGIGDIAAALIEAGKKESTPISITHTGTITEQRTITSTLGEIGADAEAAKVPAPAVTVIGPVVDLHDALSWFETKPLYGWRVLVPRTRDDSAELLQRLREYGAEPEEVPTISVQPPRNPQQIDKAVRGLVEGRYEWVAFTSINAVKAVREKFEEYGLDARTFSGLKIASVGGDTTEALLEWGLRPDLQPEDANTTHALLAVWPPYDKVLDPINRVFLPRADIATETLAAGLVELGWEADDVTAYRTVRAAPPPAPTREAIKTGKFDAVLFTSSSTVRNLVGIAGKPHATTVIATIGPATAKTAEEHRLRVDVMAAEPTAKELVDGLADFAAARRAEMIEAGQPITKPSERRPARRRRRRKAAK